MASAFDPFTPPKADQAIAPPRPQVRSSRRIEHAEKVVYLAAKHFLDLDPLQRAQGVVAAHAWEQVRKLLLSSSRRELKMSYIQWILHDAQLRGHDVMVSCSFAFPFPP